MTPGGVRGIVVQDWDSRKSERYLTEQKNLWFGMEI